MIKCQTGLFIWSVVLVLLEQSILSDLSKKIILKEKQRLEIINKLVSSYKIDVILDPKISQLSPGNFVKFNYICLEYDIIPAHNLVKNISLLLNLYKKNNHHTYLNFQEI